MKRDVRHHWSSCACGFTLVELVVVLAILLLLIAMLTPSLVLARRKARLTACAANMHGVGLAMAMYADQNEDLLPWAEANWGGASQVYVTWDDLINAELSGDLNEAEKEAPYAPRAMKILICPEDLATRVPPSYLPTPNPVFPRSYALVRTNGVSSGDGTTFGGVGGQLGTGPPPGFADRKNLCIKRGAIPLPAEQLALAEKPGPTNVLGWIGLSGLVDQPLSQYADWQWPPVKGSTIHGRVWNYLMADGHVESLGAEETVHPQQNTYYNTLAQQNYMWTRNPGD